jgi:hypothetical protein
MWAALPYLMMVIGAIVAVVGLRREWAGIMMPVRNPQKVLTFFQGFRTSVIGLALVGAGAAIIWDQTWLLVLSLAIGGEETFESTLQIFALKHGKDVRLGPASATDR